MSDEVDEALLHERLQTGAFEVTPSTEESKVQLQAMIVRVEREAQVKPRRLGLIISGSLVAALVLSGATIPGTMNIFRPTSPVQQQLFEFEYTLPSGAHCDATYGVFADADPDAVATIRRETALSPLIDEADIDAEIADMRANPDTIITIETGAKEPGGYGTKHFNADGEYTDAVAQAIKHRMPNKLLSEGFPADALGLNSWGEDRCPGALW